MLSVVAFGSTYYLNYLLRNKGGLFFLECNYDVKQTNILPIFSHELLSWWVELREIVEADRGHEYISYIHSYRDTDTDGNKDRDGEDTSSVKIRKNYTAVVKGGLHHLSKL